MFNVISGTGSITDQNEFNLIQRLIETKLCLQPVEKRLVSSMTMEVELAGDTNTWTPLLDGRTGHPLVSYLLTFCFASNS